MGARPRDQGDNQEEGAAASAHVQDTRRQHCDSSSSSSDTPQAKLNRRRPSTHARPSSHRHRRAPASLSARNAFLLLAAAVLTAPSLTTTGALGRIRQLLNGGDGRAGSIASKEDHRRGWTLGVGVLAAPCADAEGATEDGSAQEVAVSPDAGVDLLTVFDCEGGEFVVSWTGEVFVQGTIYIGRGTTVRIVGENGNTTATTTTTSLTTTTTSSSSGNATFVDENDRPQAWVEALSTRLPPLPSGLPAAAVATAPATASTTTSSSASASATTSLTTSAAASYSSGYSAANETDGAGGSSASEHENPEEAVEPRRPAPIFFVDGGQLFLENLAVRGGYTANATDSLVYTYTDEPGDPGAYNGTLLDGGVASGTNSTSVVVVSGGAVHAVDSNVTVVGCEFEDNFAELWGGAIFANGSSLVVRGSVFRRCRAGEQSFAADEGIEGAGGGIGVSGRCTTLNLP